MTHIDNSKIFHNGVYSDATIYVPANTTYKAGTVLGRNSSGKLTAFSSDLNGENFASSPLYILAQTISNEDSNAAEIELVRVFESGLVDKNGLIFIKAADASNVEYLDALHTNGFRLGNVEEQTVPSNLAE